jgi:hypothetical protein
MVVLGRRELVRARSASLKEVPVRFVESSDDIALLLAIDDLLNDPALRTSARAARDLATYIRWLSEEAELEAADARWSVRPIVAQLLGRQTGVMKALGEIVGYSERSLRARNSSCGMHRSSRPPHDCGAAEVLIQGRVACTQDGRISPAKSRSHDEPRQYVLELLPPYKGESQR